MTERLHFHFSLSCIGEGNGNPLKCSCLENPRDGGAWWAAVYGVAQSRTRLKRLSSSCSRVIVQGLNEIIQLKSLCSECHMLVIFCCYSYHHSCLVCYFFFYRYDCLHFYLGDVGKGEKGMYPRKTGEIIMFTISKTYLNRV